MTDFPDMVMEDSDRLTIPHTPSTVLVVGDVYNPGSFIYEPEYRRRISGNRRQRKTPVGPAPRLRAARQRGRGRRQQCQRAFHGDKIRSPPALPRRSDGCALQAADRSFRPRTARLDADHFTTSHNRRRAHCGAPVERSSGGESDEDTRTRNTFDGDSRSSPSIRANRVDSFFGHSTTTVKVKLWFWLPEVAVIVAV